MPVKSITEDPCKQSGYLSSFQALLEAKSTITKSELIKQLSYMRKLHLKATDLSGVLAKNEEHLMLLKSLTEGCPLSRVELNCLLGSPVLEGQTDSISIKAVIRERSQLHYNRMLSLVRGNLLAAIKEHMALHMAAMILEPDSIREAEATKASPAIVNEYVSALKVIEKLQAGKMISQRELNVISSDKLNLHGSFDHAHNIILIGDYGLSKSKLLRTIDAIDSEPTKTPSISLFTKTTFFTKSTEEKNRSIDCSDVSLIIP
ncbi:MAG: hypothetical protein Q7V63_02315 [Gammaproteobacteria bacterium]|nr:hypothetical protein [Gammaproteobacteria bacterium]